MNLLLAPGIRLMNRLRYPWKFGLMGLISLIMLGYLSACLLATLFDDIRASKRGIEGLAPVESLLHVVQLSQQHRGLSAGVLGGSTELKPKLDAKRAELLEALQKADQTLAQAQLGDSIGARWKQIRADWQSLQSEGPGMTVKDNVAAHTRLIATQILSIHDVADTSGLVLVGDAESHYAIDNVVKQIPSLAERLGRLRAAGTAVLASKEIDEQRRIDISVQLGAMDTMLEDFNENLDRAAAHNPEQQSRLGALKAKVGEDTGRVTGELRNRILKGVLDTPPAEYFDLATRAIDGTYAEIFGNELPELRGALASHLRAKEHAAWLTLGVGGVALLLLAYLSLAAYFVVMGSVRELSRAAGEMAQGDLRAEINFSSQDELQDVAQQFRRMASAFQSVIREVQRGAGEVTASASSLAANAARVSRGSEQQSEAASSMAAAVEEMTVGVDEISRNAGAAEEISTRSGSLSDEGGAVVARAMSEMQGIADVVRQSAQVIEDLGVQSEKISAMVSSIQEIADQTNLLALNAAIEAARAGETGRGFAVVADEVRKLAERTGQATREITSLVTAIQGGTHKAVATMQNGVARVEQGVVLTEEAGQSMEQISAGAGRVVQAIGDISLALREQSAASTEIAKNVERIANRAEENTIEVRETAATAGRLESLARTLQEQVGRFKV